MRVLVLLLFPLIIYSYQWSSPQLVGEGDRCRFALDCNQQLWCIFLESNGLYASYYVDSQWSPPVFIRNGRADDAFDVTTAQDGKLWVLNLNSSSQYWTLYYDGTAWSDTFSIPGYYNFHLAADSAGKVWAVYNSGANYIRCDVCDDTTWTGPYVVYDYPTDQVWNSCVTIAPNNTRWVGAQVMSMPLEQIFLCRSDSTGAWSDSLIMGPQMPWIVLFGVSSDNVGNIWILWSTYNGNDTLFAAMLDSNLNWSPYYQISDSMELYWECSNLTVDSENKVWVVYDKFDHLSCRVWDGIAWSPEDTVHANADTIADPLNDVFYDPTTGRIWVAYAVVRYGVSPDTIYTTWTNALGNIEDRQKIENPIRQNLTVRPNPVMKNLMIHYNMIHKGSVSLRLYDNAGRLVKDLYTGEKSAGNYTECYFLKDLPGGVYHLLLKTEGISLQQKFIIIK